jgi:hypothetical protein
MATIRHLGQFYFTHTHYAKTSCYPRFQLASLAAWGHQVSAGYFHLAKPVGLPREARRSPSATPSAMCSITLPIRSMSPTPRRNHHVIDLVWEPIASNPQFVADVDGDGLADIVAFGDEGVWIARSKGDGTSTFPDPARTLSASATPAARARSGAGPSRQRSSRSPISATIPAGASTGSRPRRPLSRGSSPAGHPAEPLVSYQINRQLSGWIPPPLVIRAFGAHCQQQT